MLAILWGVALKTFTALIVALLVGGIAFGFYRSMSYTAAVQTPSMNPASITTVIIGVDSTSTTRFVVHVEVADTEDKREQGLSGRAGLQEGSGMLFVFDVPGKYGFWMKDMNFPIDIIFIDASGTVVSVVRDASPESYHLQPPQVFYPDLPAQYVLEVPAGFVASRAIGVGERVTFK